MAVESFIINRKARRRVSGVTELTRPPTSPWTELVDDLGDGQTDIRAIYPEGSPVAAAIERETSSIRAERDFWQAAAELRERLLVEHAKELEAVYARLKDVLYSSSIR